ncbi:MAG: hypothetical protein EXS01_05810 [Phycisphaerales bacterium]|nr:hypothetical protein [Phycisphaerales bacterium]
MDARLVILMVFTCTATLSAQTVVPGQRDHSTRVVDRSSDFPVEPTVADRGPLTMPLREMPLELAEPQGFDRVYAVPGKPGMFYRASGGLYAVFDEAEYSKNKQQKMIARPGAGLTYYIGKPDWSKIQQTSIIPGGGVQAQQQLRDEQPIERTSEAIEAERPSVSNHETSELHSARVLASPAPIGSESRRVCGNDVGFGGGSARPSSSSDSTEDAEPVQFESKFPDVAALAGTLPAGVDRTFMVGEGNAVRPRIAADFLYRHERLTLLMQRALHASPPK